jgi:hypothetical protein
MTITARDRLRQLIDSLPQRQWSAAERALEQLHLLTTKEVDDEPWTDEDEAAVREAEAEFARDDGVSSDNAAGELLR